jgi:hypothetical protein
MEPLESSTVVAGPAGVHSQASAPDKWHGQPRRGRVWAAALLGAAVASVSCWLLGELAVGAFQPRLFMVERLGQTSVQPTTASKNSADLKNAILAHAIYGCVIGLVMGIAGGMAARSLQRAVIVALGAQAVGAIVSAGASFVILPFFFRNSVPDMNDLLLPILLHGGIWAAIGAVGGAAFACGAGRPPRLIPLAVGDACVAAFLASIVFHLASAEVFPEGRSIDPVAGSSIVRLLAVALLAGFIAVGAARGTAARIPRAAA